jgi:hypothetical protein
MHRRTVSLLAVILITATSAVAQWINYPTPGIPRTADSKPNLSAPTPNTADGKPDLSGLWMAATELVKIPFGGGTFIERPPQFLDIAAGVSGGLPLQPWARDLMKARQTDNGKDVPIAYCLPPGPILGYSLSPKKLVQTPGLLLILGEFNTMYRQIFTDGRPLPRDPQPSWNGYSTGHWDRDTLVVESNGFRDGLWLDVVAGTPMTDAAMLTERFRRPNFGTLEIEATVDDNKAYTKPWTVKLTQKLMADTDLLEFVCLENEKDVRHLTKQ